MSRSVRRRPFNSINGHSSQKRDKQICNRIMRHANRQALAVNGENAWYMIKHEALNRWEMVQDGRRSYQPFDPAPRWLVLHPGGLSSSDLWYRWYRCVKAK
jgi:hypothetical protein